MMCAVENPQGNHKSVVADSSIKLHIMEHADFFDHLVDLVPAKHYFDNESQHAANTKYMKKSARKEVARQWAEEGKKRKRNKLDPEKAQTTLDVQVQSLAKLFCAPYAIGHSAQSAKFQKVCLCEMYMLCRESKLRGRSKGVHRISNSSRAPQPRQMAHLAPQPCALMCHQVRQ